jgi:hypothetical protein
MLLTESKEETKEFGTKTHAMVVLSKTSSKEKPTPWQHQRVYCTVH